MTDEQLPPDPPIPDVINTNTPSSLSPGERETIHEFVSAIDRHTEAVNRAARAFERIAEALAHDVEMRHHAVK